MKKLISKKMLIKDEQMNGVVSDLQQTVQASVIEGQGVHLDKNIELALSDGCPTMVNC